MTKSKSTINPLLIVSLMLLAFLIRIYQLGKESLWFDEALSVYFATQPIGTAIRAMLQEGLQNSPLFYLILRPFAAISFSEFSLRLPSVILGVITIPLIAKLGEILDKPQVGLLAATFTAINPFLVWYSRETRMYSFLALIAVGAMLYFSKIIFQSSKDWRTLLGLSFFIALGINTHHFAFFIILIQFLFLLFTFRINYSMIRYWVLSLVLALLCFLPWIIIVINNGEFYGGSGGALSSNIMDLFYTFWNFGIGYTQKLDLFVLLILSLFLVLLLSGLKYFSKPKQLLAIWLLAPPLITFALSFRLPMYADRYLIISLPAFILLISMGVNQIPGQTSRLLVTTLLIFSMVFGLTRIYFDTNVYGRADWRTVSAYLEKNVDSACDSIYTLYYQDLVLLNLYYRGSVPISPIVVLNQANLPVGVAPEASNSKTWVILPYPNSSKHLIGHCQPLNPERVSYINQVNDWYYQQQAQSVLTEEFTCIRVEVFE